MVKLLLTSYQFSSLFKFACYGHFPIELFLDTIRRFISLCIARTTDTQWRHKSKISEKLGWCGRQNMLRPYLKIWDWDWIFGSAVKAVSFLDIRSPWLSAFSCWHFFTVFFCSLQYIVVPCNYLRPSGILCASLWFFSVLRSSLWFFACGTLLFFMVNCCYRVSHIETCFLNWLWEVERQIILLNYGT